MMRRTLHSLLAAAALGTAVPLAAQSAQEAQGTAPQTATAAASDATTEAPRKRIDIREVAIYGRRPLKETGIQRTVIDSTALHENIARSIADVLAFNSSIFVKNHGRATLSTVSFRGTSASHTQVTWNGMRINSPMLGTTDFSMIPAHFIDDASLLHGTSSVTETGGGLGGAVKLATAPVRERGFGLRYVQGIGSFRTFDEFLRLTYGNDRWQSSTRIALATSPNDYPYRNRDKKENIYDDDRNIVGTYHPVERNRSGAYRDLHLLQELYYDTGRGDRLGLNAWYVDSYRELPQLTVEYGDQSRFENYQREHTLRSLLSWERLRSRWKLGLRAGYIHSRTSYDYRTDRGNGIMAQMIRSRNRTDTFFAKADGEWSAGERWFLTAGIAAYQHLVHSIDRTVSAPTEGAADGSERRVAIGYRKGRTELSAFASAKWRPTERLGLSLVVREESYGTEWAAPIPALFADWLLARRGNLLLKASVSRNYRFPTLNDRYFQPGGNPDLRPESGFTYDAGISFATNPEKSWSLKGNAAWFDARIDDWILWLPTVKGFYSPVNVKRVHAYGIELQATLDAALAREWQLTLDGHASWTPSINEGDPMSEGDRSVGKQLVYVPEYTASLTGSLRFRTWSLLYKWCYYSERYTMTSNDRTLTGYLPPYFMNGVTLEKRFAFRRLDLSLKGSVENLFDEEYLSVLSRPMPGIHFEFFVGITPKWGKKAGK